MENSVTLQGRGTHVPLGPAQHAQDARSLHVPQLTDTGGISEPGRHAHSTRTSRDKYALYVTKLMVRKVYRCAHVKSLKGRKELIKLLLPGIYITEWKG